MTRMIKKRLWKKFAFILALGFFLHCITYLLPSSSRLQGNPNIQLGNSSHNFLSVMDEVFENWKTHMRTNFSKEMEFVLGIPTITRDKENYLYETLLSLLDNMGNETEVVIVVFVGEENETIVSQTKENLYRDFPIEMEKEIIQVIGPPKNFYPKLQDNMHMSFGDSLDRVKWRSKQVIDQVFLMMYSYYLKPKFYVMLEDDIIASKNYMTEIRKDTEEKKDERYVMLMYSQLGNIGRLFRRESLPSIATYLCLFWSDKPVDWLVLDYIRSRECNPGKSDKACNRIINEMAIAHKPSLFQHMGKISSLSGKIQKLKDKSFVENFKLNTLT